MNQNRIVEEEKGQAANKIAQSTLDRHVQNEDFDSEYGHLVTHLIEQDEELGKKEYWTRVFTRDSQVGLRVSIHMLGPDLIFDKSIRDSMGDTTQPTGEVLFSPFMIKAADLAKDLAECEIPLDQLL